MGGIAIRDWSLSFQDMEFLSSLPESVCLEAGLQICSVRSSGRFIEDWTDVDAGAIEFVASQLDMQAVRPSRLFSDRTARRYRLEVARHLDLSRPRERHRAELQDWLRSAICPSGDSMVDMLDQCFHWFRDQGLLPPTEGVLIRSIRTARSAFVDDFLKQITGSLPTKTVTSLEACLADPRGDHGFQRLKDDVGAATLDNVLNAADRLAFIWDLELPFDVIRAIDPSWIKLLSRRVEGETASEMRRHNREKRLGLLALYIMSRRSHLIDGLVDLLIDVVHRIGTRSKTKVISKIAADINKVHGKERLLVDIATAAIMAPNGKLSDVIFPIAGAAKLKAIIDEHRAKGTLDVQIQMVMRGSYASHYRPMLPSLLSVLRFRSNNETWRPILDALSLIIRLNEEGRRFTPVALAPEGSIPHKWRATVLDERGRINVISYELCVLSQLRERIRAKEIWIEGADRHRNPDNDLPKDFPEKRATYYNGLNLTQDAKAFAESVRALHEQELLQLNATLPNNDKVRLRWSGDNRISITPFKPAPEPKGLIGLKSEVNRRWPMTGLLDALKETALDTGFLDAFETSASREALPAEVRNQRLLLSLYGLGTNAGLKRVAAGVPGTSYDELLHIRRRYIDPASLRAAAARVADATLAIRKPTIWGEVGTACASDSTKFGA